MVLTDKEKLYILQLLKNKKNTLEENLNYALEKEEEENIADKYWEELLLIY